MNIPRRYRVAITLLALALGPQAVQAQPLSYWLGAAKLDGLRNFTDCQNQARGFRETLIADRLEKKLAFSTAIKPNERKVWQDNIDALRDVVTKRTAFRPPNRDNANQYLEGLNQDEFRAIQEMTTRYTQEINLSCEQKYGSMSRTRDGDVSSAQTQLEARMRAQLVEPTDVSSLPLAALPSLEKAPEVPLEVELAGLRAQQQANMAASQNAVARMSACTAQVASLQWSLMGDKLQAKLASGSGLSAQQRTDLEADIRAMRSAAAQNLPQPPAVDPANPYRFMTWLTPDESAAFGTEYGAAVTAHMAKCSQP